MNQITGTLINYYFHCKTQLWLFANKINLEDNSEEVRAGIVLHLFNYHGNYSGTFYPKEQLISGDLVVKQSYFYLHERKK